jgi:hypothetical protein
MKYLVISALFLSLAGCGGHMPSRGLEGTVDCAHVNSSMNP